jgi:hypothetical protein
MLDRAKHIPQIRTLYREQGQVGVDKRNAGWHSQDDPLFDKLACLVRSARQYLDAEELVRCGVDCLVAPHDTTLRRSGLR